jgi:arylsulfatase A-like enzyme
VKTTPGALDPRWDLGVDLPGEEVADDLRGERKRPNLLRLLSSPEQGYDVAWKGKWHLSPHCRSSTKPSFLKWYGTTSPWNPPDAGHSLSHPSTLGGGRKYNHDGRYLRGVKRRFEKPFMTGDADDTIYPYVISDDDSDSTSAEDEEEECIFDFLAKHTLSGTKGRDGMIVESTQQSSLSPRPFFLIASLVNPHDVWASGYSFLHLTDEEFYKETGYHPREFEDLPIDLPPNYGDDLSNKPLIQSILRKYPVFGDLSTDTNETEARQSDALRYIRFYAHLHRCVDAEIGSLLDALDETGQMENTIIIRMADHGEQALSHGLREKRMQCYEETMGIPLVVNYPSGWFNGSSSTETQSVRNLVSSIDILPTIAELTRTDCSQFHHRGKSLVRFFGSEKDSSSDDTEDEVLFTFDEPLAPRGIPGYVRCIRTPDHKYAVYFTADGQIVEYEMYDLSADPNEMDNLCKPNVVPDEGWHYYHGRLTSLMKRMGAVPEEFDWETMTKPRKCGWD